MSELNLTLINVGHGDSLFLHFLDDRNYSNPENYFALIDSNDTTNLKPSLIYLKKFFTNYEEVIRTKYNIPNYNLNPKLEFLLLTHDHADHSRGLLTIAKEYRPSIFYLFKTNQPLAATVLLKNLKRLGIVINFIDNSNVFTFGQATIKVLWPQNGNFNSEENNNSLVILIEYNKISYLLTGDLEADCWSNLSPHLNNNVQVIKMPHHGAYNSLFYNKLTPMLDDFKNKKMNPTIGISCQYFNANTNYPNNDVISEFNKNKIKFFKTSSMANITFQTDGIKVNIKNTL